MIDGRDGDIVWSRILRATFYEKLEILEPIDKSGFLSLESQDFVACGHTRIKAVPCRSLVLSFASTEREVVLRRVAVLAWLHHS